MPQLILFIVGAIVWGIIKALSQPQQKTPPGRQSPRTIITQLGLDPEDSRFDAPTDYSQPFSVPPAVRPKARPQPAVRPPEVRPQTITPAPVEAETAEPNWLTTENLVQGVIMAELLSPPRAKRPRRI